MFFSEITKQQYEELKDTGVKGVKGTTKGSIIKQSDKYYKLMLGNVNLNVKTFSLEEFSKKHMETIEEFFIPKIRMISISLHEYY